MILPVGVMMGQLCGTNLPASVQLTQQVPLFGRGPCHVALVFYWPDAVGQPEGAWYALGFGDRNRRATLACESEERARAAARAQRWVRSRPTRTSISIPWREAHAAGLIRA